jgi:DNA-binding NarL/FixJ family response regulator
MPDRQLAHPRMAAATLRRIVALALPRSSYYAARAIAAPGLVAAVPGEHASHRPGIYNPRSAPRAEEAATSVAEGRRSGKQLEELRVLLVDDHDLFRTGLRSLLEEQGLQVVGDADNGRDALRLVGELAPDVVVMDLKMPGLTGVETTRQVSGIAPRTRVVVLTISVDDDDVMDAVMAGACGYLLKDSSIDQLIAGIRAAASGESLISPQIAAKVLQRLRAQTADTAAARTIRTELSDRELEVLRLIAIGKDNAEIARELFISPKTVKNHISNILMKLQIENRIQAAVYAVRSGLV